MNPTDEQVEKAHKTLMSELFMLCQPNLGDVFSFMDDQKEAVRAALTAAGVKPRVKPLEWCGDSDRYAYSDVTSKAYLIAFEEGVYWASWDAALPPFDTIAEAKAAAQADYEARILSALTTEGE